MRTASATLIAAQTAAVRVPYFHMVFTNLATGATFDCSGATSRIESITHTEGAYSGGASIILNNSDRGVIDLRGYYVEIGYGDVVSFLPNSSFEAWTSGPSSPPDGWSCPFGGTNAAARSTDKVTGSYAAQFTGGSADGRCARTDVSLINGQLYSFGLWLKSVSGSKVVSLVLNDTNTTNAVTITTSYAYYTFTATYTGATGVGGVDIHLGSVSSVILVDEMVGSPTVPDYSATPRLWVRDQTWTSSEGLLISTLTLIDGFSHLAEMPVELGTAPDYYYGPLNATPHWNRDTTPYMIMDAVMSGAGFTLNTWDREPVAGSNTADLFTSTSQIWDSALISTVDDFYNGWYLYNVTRATGSVITDYSGAGKILTISPPVAGQTTGDTYIILKSDEIITSFKPYFEVNAGNETGLTTLSYEDRREVCYRAIMQTKSYLRARPGMVFDIIFPRSIEAVDLAYNTSQFYDFNQKLNEVVPNAVYVYCNQTTDAAGNPSWASMFTGIAKDTDAIARNNGVEIKGFYYAPTIDTQLDADNFAAALMTRIKAETLSVGVVIPHDCRMELYDFVQVTDTRA